MTTARDLVETSLRELRVYAPGESLDDADLAEGFAQLNVLLDYLSNDSAACFALLEQSFPLVANTSRYSIGTGGAFNGPRPIRLIYGPGAARVRDFNNVDYNVDVWPQDRFNDLNYKAQTADFPTVMFYDPQFPLGYINVFPVPTQAFTLLFDSYLQLANLANYTAALSFPPGYQPMLQHNLTVWLAPFYKNAQLNPVIATLAQRTLTVVKRMNRRQNMADYDPELLVRGTAAYNVYSDSYAR